MRSRVFKSLNFCSLKKNLLVRYPFLCTHRKEYITQVSFNSSSIWSRGSFRVPSNQEFKPNDHQKYLFWVWQELIIVLSISPIHRLEVKIWTVWIQNSEWTTSTYLFELKFESESINKERKNSKFKGLPTSNPWELFRPLNQRRGGPHGDDFTSSLSCPTKLTKPTQL